MRGAGRLSETESNGDRKKIIRVLLDSYITKFEMKAFGWNYEHTNEEQTSQDLMTYYDEKKEELHTNITVNYDKFMYFSRRKKYAKSLLFRIVEFLYKITSAIRRWGMGLILVAIPIWLIMLLYTLISGTTTIPMILWSMKYLGIFYAAILVVPALFTGVGFALRKLFRLDVRE